MLIDVYIFTCFNPYYLQFRTQAEKGAFIHNIVTFCGGGKGHCQPHVPLKAILRNATCHFCLHLIGKGKSYR